MICSFLIYISSTLTFSTPVVFNIVQFSPSLSNSPSPSNSPLLPLPPPSSLSLSPPPSPPPFPLSALRTRSCIKLYLGALADWDGLWVAMPRGEGEGRDHHDNILIYTVYVRAFSHCFPNTAVFTPPTYMPSPELGAACSVTT